MPITLSTASSRWPFSARRFAVSGPFGHSGTVPPPRSVLWPLPGPVSFSSLSPPH